LPEGATVVLETVGMDRKGYVKGARNLVAASATTFEPMVVLPIEISRSPTGIPTRQARPVARMRCASLKAASSAHSNSNQRENHEYHTAYHRADDVNVRDRIAHRRSFVWTFWLEHGRPGAFGGVRHALLIRA
jgi:hypothetical protein